jgi:integrase
VSRIEKHVRPTIGRLQVGRVKADTIEGLYAQLRRCRDHCRGAKYVQHRTADEHVCDEHSARRKCKKVVTGDPMARCPTCEWVCGPHQCVPLAAGSIRVVHAILSGAFMRAVRWGWIAVSPVEQTEPPATPRPNPSPPTAAKGRRVAQRGGGGPRLEHLHLVRHDRWGAPRRAVHAALVAARP